MELVRLDGEDHSVYRCRDCGFLFSPPPGYVHGENVIPAPAPDGPEEARRRLAQVSAVRARPATGASR